MKIYIEKQHLEDESFNLLEEDKMLMGKYSNGLYAIYLLEDHLTHIASFQPSQGVYHIKTLSSNKDIYYKDLYYDDEVNRFDGLIGDLNYIDSIYNLSNMYIEPLDDISFVKEVDLEDKPCSKEMLEDLEEYYREDFTDWVEEAKEYYDNR